MSNENPAREELPAILTVEQVGQFLRISRGMAYQLVHRGDFPAIRIGRAIRVEREAFLRWLEAQAGSRPGEAEPGQPRAADKKGVSFDHTTNYAKFIR